MSGCGPCVAGRPPQRGACLSGSLQGDGQPVFTVVGRAHVATVVHAINFNIAFKWLRGRSDGHGFTDFVGKHKGRLVLAIQIAADLHHGKALGTVHDQANRSQQIDKRHLAASEYGAGRNRELIAATLALELAAGADFIGVCAATTAANRWPLVEAQRTLQND